MKFEARPYQSLIIDAVTTIKRVNIFASMGTGKTISLLSAIHQMYLEGPVLVLAPLRVAISTWPDEVAKWDHLSDMKISVITGKPKERRKALATPAMVYTCNYENIEWLIKECGDDWPFVMIVADESTKLKGFRIRGGSKRAAALNKVAHAKTSRFVNLTGTPAPNGLMDLWGQCWFIDKGQRLGRSITDFRDRWFWFVRAGASMYAGRYELMPHSAKQIETAISGISLTIDARDYFDIRKPIEIPVKLKLPAQAMKLYREMERLMFIELDDIEIEAMNAAAKTSKCLQLAAGAIYDSDHEWSEVHDVKLQALESIIEESMGAPVLVSYQWLSDLERLQKYFPKGRVLNADPQTLRDWNAGKIPLLFAHPASAGHGLNMQDGGNILVFFSLGWNLEHHQQIIERIGPTRQAQAGYDRPVFLYYLIASNTLDEEVLDRLQGKASVQEALLMAMKRNAT